MEQIRTFFGYRTLKTAFGAALAIFISQRLGLSYAANSGIIVILSIQTTRRKSLDLGVMRLGSTVLALGIGSMVFSTVGFTATAFGLYLLIFIPVAVRLKFHEGIVPCSVLVSHILSVQSVSWFWLGNEMMQMVIGAGMGFLLNMHMPNLENQLMEQISDIERVVRSILTSLAGSLRNRKSTSAEEALYQELESELKTGYELAVKEAGNHLNREVSYFIRYMEMRSIQFETLKYMKKYSRRIYQCSEETEQVARLTEFVVEQFHEMNTKEDVMKNLKEYMALCWNMELPKSRGEFETRAALHEYIHDLENLLETKRNFIKNLSEKDLERYRLSLEESETAPETGVR